MRDRADHDRDRLPVIALGAGCQRNAAAVRARTGGMS
jgi:hypothetical protein